MGRGSEHLAAAVERLTLAALELEADRRLVVTRARVAIAAGATLRDVAAATGVDARTMRTWLAERARDPVRWNSTCSGIDRLAVGPV